MAEVYPSIAELIPHAGTMVLLDELVHWAPGEAQCRLTIAPGMPFVSDDAVDTIVSIEYMAQAVAACCGYAGFRSGDGIRVGMIIGCRRMDIKVPKLAVGDELMVHVREIRGHDEISVYRCEVLRGAESVASAQLTLYHAERPPGEGESFL
jgi:predicted hotdog family 3-hydroxylacyl-ACP dehydratase